MSSYGSKYPNRSGITSGLQGLTDAEAAASRPKSAMELYEENMQKLLAEKDKEIAELRRQLSEANPVKKNIEYLTEQVKDYRPGNVTE